MKFAIEKEVRTSERASIEKSTERKVQKVVKYFKKEDNIDPGHDHREGV